MKSKSPNKYFANNNISNYNNDKHKDMPLKITVLEDNPAKKNK